MLCLNLESLEPNRTRTVLNFTEEQIPDIVLISQRRRISDHIKFAHAKILVALIECLYVVIPIPL